MHGAQQLRADALMARSDIDRNRLDYPQGAGSIGGVDVGRQIDDPMIEKTSQGVLREPTSLDKAGKLPFTTAPKEHQRTGSFADRRRRAEISLAKNAIGQGNDSLCARCVCLDHDRFCEGPFWPTLTPFYWRETSAPCKGFGAERRLIDTHRDVDPDDRLARVLGLMTRHRVRHILVLQGGQLSGLISIGDVVKRRLDELEMEAAVQRDSYFARN